MAVDFVLRPGVRPASRLGIVRCGVGRALPRVRGNRAAFDLRSPGDVLRARGLANVAAGATDSLAACRGRYNGKQLEGISGNLLLDHATIFNQPFRDFHTEIEVKKEAPQVLSFKGLHAKIFGGEVYGPIRIEFGPTTRYEINLTASQIRMDEFAKHNLEKGAELSGLATGRLYLAGQGTDVNSLVGHGT